MKSTIPKTHLFTQSDLRLYEIQNIFAACSLWLENNMEKQIATHDLYIRDMPKNRNFLLFGGLEEVILGLKKWRYSKDEIQYLQKHQLATPKLVKYLENFKFSGDLYSLPEGTVFFPSEPVIKITARLLEGNLITLFLMNTICSNTIFLSKLIRGKIACQDKRFIAGGGMRAQSFESAMKGSRAGYIVGAHSGFPSFSRKYNLNPPPISINAYHAVIKSFPTELEAFRAAAKLFPNRARPMVDTYNFKQGIKNLIKVARELKEKNQHFAEITIDSGDLHQRAVYVRKAFDQAGFPEIKITLASNLDEWKIAELIRKKTPADTFLAQTEMACVTDDPKLEIVYKLAELKDGKKIRPVAKFAAKKISYPGKKQIYRRYKNDRMIQDIIGLEQEKLGHPLLKKMINQGKLIYKLPSLPTIQEYTKSQVLSLPSKLKSINKQYHYPVKTSNKLEQLFLKVKKSSH